MNKHVSPYLSHGRRLSDLLAALQVMGTYRWATRKSQEWTKMLGPVKSADNWEEIFSQHTEFFRVNGEWVSLRWRHGYDRIYSADLGRELEADEIKTLSKEENENLSRRPLTPEQIEALLKTAIELHTREIAYTQERRWLTPFLFALLGAILGAILKLK